MKTNLFLRARSSLLVLCFTFLATTMAWGQIISQYVETNSGTSPKGIEIWNNTGATLDFSTNNLEIQQGTNGGTPTTLVTVSSGTLASGEVMVIGTSDMGTYLTNQSLTSVAYEDYTFSFNGDDALVVEYGGVVTDVFGNPGSDPGSSWDGNGVSTADQNIQLLDGITTGDTNGWTDPSSRFETVSTDPTNDLTGFGVAPELTASPLLSVATTTLTGFEYIEGSGPSASQSFDVSGTNLDGSDVILLAGTGFEISESESSGYSDEITLANYDGDPATIYVRLAAGEAIGNYNDIVLISGGDAPDIEVDLSGEVTPVPQPELNIDATSLTGINYMEGNGPSAAQTVTLTGANLDGTQDVTVELLMEAASNFEISQDDVTYSDSFTLTNYDGSATDIYVRLKAGLTEYTYDDFILINGYDVTEVEVELSGEVTPFIDQYSGEGEFELVTSLADLEDGYYVVANETSEYLMTNENSGYFLSEDLILDSSNNVVNPATDRVWYIEADGDGYTIYNEVTEKYVGWFSGNSASEEDNVTDNTRWTFNYQDDKFTVNNVATPDRQLSYNAGAPRFAAYGNNFQQELQLYKYSITTADFTWEDGVWSPQTPIGNATATDDILIVNGSAAFNGDVELNNLYVQNGATLEVENVLKVNGDIENNGSIVFKSTSVANTAQFDVFNGTISGNGSFTAERYFPANRAFRLIASSIDGGSIYENWQENGNYQAAIGTHITGGDLTDGFDQSGSDNPSLFTYDNTLEDQTGQAAWNAVANTNATNIDAGTPYRLFVRGDRDIDLTSNDSPANQTIIRTTGSLHTGDFSPSISAVGGNFSFIGNPYQAIVDATQLQFTGDINNNFMYVWDASVNDNGAYVTVDLSDNSNDGSTSDASQFIQPGQAVFFRNNETFSTAPSVTFTESAKATSESLTTIFNQEDTNRLNIRLYAAEDHQDEEREIDAVSMRFSETFSNEVNDFDAAKLGNIDENLALFTDNNLLAIERREIPMHEEEMQLVVVNYRSDEYVLEFLIDELPEDANLSVYDEYLDTTTEITSAENTYAYSVDQSISESTNPFRFKLMFDMETFSTETVQHQELSFYPNPVNQKASLYLPNNTANYEIAVFDILGNRLNIDLPNLEESRTQLDFSTLSSGVYILKLYGEENQHQIKFIKN
ncbi:MAG: T9SS type A sorting domain-containing protein [Bacteroidota bacterium]